MSACGAYGPARIGWVCLAGGLGLTPRRASLTLMFRERGAYFRKMHEKSYCRLIVAAGDGCTSNAGADW
jgi:hypothetical protein